MSEGASNERRILWLERKLAELMGQLVDLKARTRAAEEQQSQAWIAMAGVGAAGGAIQIVIVTTTGALATGTPGSPATCSATRFDTGASITLKNVLGFSASYASGKTVISVFDGTTYLALSGSC